MSGPGWQKEQFGISWQIIPTILGKLMQDKDPAKASLLMQAMMGMMRLDIAKLPAAYDGQ